MCLERDWMIRKYYMVACYCIGILLCWFSVRYMVDGSVASVGPEDRQEQHGMRV